MIQFPATLARWNNTKTRIVHDTPLHSADLPFLDSGDQLSTFA
jgi:hypothetical protein